jgi:excinuclease UvrABC ATPase subunit
MLLEDSNAVIEQADWIIDLGPDGGKNGGEIVFTGMPERLVAAKDPLTGEHLRCYQSRSDLPCSDQRRLP